MGFDTNKTSAIEPMKVCPQRRAYNGSDGGACDVHLAACITDVWLFVFEPGLSVHLAAFA